MTEENKKEYEISFLLKSADLISEIDNALKIIQANISERGQLKDVRLAYPIQKHHSGFFGFYFFEADPAVMADLRQSLTLNEKVLRFLIITPPIKKRQPYYQGRPSSVASEPSTNAVPRPVQLPQVLSNEALEQKLEEILK